MRYFALPILFALGCGGASSPTSPTDTSSLTGPLAFQPNSTVVVEAALAGGPVFDSMADIDLVNSSPPIDCKLLDAGGGVAQSAEVTVQLGQTGGIAPGTFNVTNYQTFSSSPFFTSLAYLRVGGPTTTLAESFSGTVTMTKVGDEWAGNFDVMLLSSTDGGQTSMSGHFDTTEVCVGQVPL